MTTRDRCRSGWARVALALVPLWIAACSKGAGGESSIDAGALGAPAIGGRGAGGSTSSGAGGSVTGSGGSAGVAGSGGVAGAGGPHVAAPNFLDRLDFGDRGSGPTSESAHNLVQPAPTTGTGMFGRTYRVIAASTATPGDPSTNAVLTFNLACDPAAQNYLTVKLWGGDAKVAIIYLYDPARGYEQSDYNGQSVPEVDIQEDATPMAPGRFVYVTMPIPIASTQGKQTVSLTLNAAKSFSYYGGRTTTQLGTGDATRPIYSAFSHTVPMLNLLGDDVQTAGAAPTPATPLTFNAAYVTSLQQRYKTRIDNYRDATLGGGAWVQAWGPAWDAAVAAGTVPPQVVGLFLGNVTPGNSRTPAAWLDFAATTTSTGNNNPMLRLDDMGFAFASPNLAPTYFQSAELRSRIIAGIDAAFYMQSLNGALGSLTAWVGLGATTATAANPQGRLTAAGNAIEGNGTLALGSAFFNLSTDATFLAALDQPINATLAPGVMRYQAWGQLFSRHVAFLLTRHGSAPNQDILQARSLIAANQAAKLIDRRKGTAYAISDAMVTAYAQSACGVTASSKGPRWFSPAGLSLEVHGIGNGGFDGSYGMNGMVLAVEAAKMLADAGLETDAAHPVRDVALSAVHAFGNFVVPSLTPAGVVTLRREEAITFRKNFNVGEIGAAASYLAAFQFADAVALHRFHLERLFGMSPPEWSSSNIDEGQNRMFRWGAAYVGLVQNAITAAAGGAVTDSSGVTLLHEDAHVDGAWADAVAGALSFKQHGQHGLLALNWRPYGYGDATAYVQPSATGTLSNIARLHVITPVADRIVTVYLPTNAATGATASFTSGGYGGLYLVRYGPLVAALNLGAATASFTVPAPPGLPSAFAHDWVTNAAHDLTASRSLSVPAGSGALLTLGADAGSAMAASALAY